MAVQPVLGSRKCIGGAQYVYSVGATAPGATNIPPSGVVTPTEQSTDTSDTLLALANVLIPEFTYAGMYRNVPNFQIQADASNYELIFGFPVRTFQIDTETPISIRLADKKADEIFLDHQTSPFKLANLPAGLAFDRIYVNNTLAQAITISLFAMG